MTDRIATITATPAAQAFPALAAFLANSTQIAPDVAEAALRAACADHAVAATIIASNKSWATAVTAANQQFSEQTPAAATEKPTHPWGGAVAEANRRIGGV